MERLTKEKGQPRIDRPHVADKTWKVAAHGRVTRDWREITKQQMATPGASDNRVAPAQMDGRHVHNKQTGAHSPLWSTVEMDGERAAVYLAGKPATWTFRLWLDARSRPKAHLHQPDMDQDCGQMA